MKKTLTADARVLEFEPTAKRPNTHVVTDSRKDIDSMIAARAGEIARLTAANAEDAADLKEMDKAKGKP